VKNLSPVLLELSVTVPAVEIDRAVDQAIGKLARETRLPGFRRGKVPRAVIQRMFGKALLADLRGELVAGAYVEALAEHGIDPVAEPELDIERFGELARGRDFEFAIEVPIAPRLEQARFEGVEIRRRPMELPADLIDKELESIRARLATAVDLDEPRPARVGDLLRVEVERRLDGGWKRSEPPVDELILDPEHVSEQFVEALSGAVPGDVREVELPPPEGAGTGLGFRFRVVELKERRLPVLDDELARDASEFETLAELRADIERHAREVREAEERKRLRHDLFDALREKNELELPETLVRRQARAMQENLRGMLGLGSGESAADEAGRAVQDAMLAGAEKTAREIVHQHFLVRELARLHDLEVTEADVAAEFEALAARSGLPVPRVRAEFAKEGRRHELEARLLEDKVFDFALARVTVLEAEAPPAEGDGGKDRS
jgi:trigger factor